MMYKIVCLVLTLAWSISGISQQDSMRVLILGNSYTYFWNLPNQINVLAASQNIPLVCTQSTRGGVNLGQHWRGERGLQSRAQIKSLKYTHVVLQDHSLRALLAPDSLIYYGELFGNLINNSDAQSIVYLTWARRDNPLMQAKNNLAYEQLAEKINAVVAPVGPAWEKARQLRPELELYDPDGSHPSIIGTYLTACVFYGVITGESPLGLTGRLHTTDSEGRSLFLNSVPVADAHFLQQVAWDTVIEFLDNE